MIVRGKALMKNIVRFRLSGTAIRNYTEVLKDILRRI
jgi:uncharacterized Fe-S cluster-containing protein